MPLITNANEEGIEVEVNPVGQMSVDVSSTGTNPPIVAEIDNIITAEEVPVIDTASKFTATNVEGVLAELDDKILEAGQVDDVKNGDGVSLVTNKIATVTPQNIGAYTKPNSGIPKTDLASDVQTSLGKADSALQSESDPTVPSWAKQTNKPTYTKSEVGLGNVDNTADLDKPISTATQTALDNKVPNTRKVNNKALSEDITLSASDVGALPSNTTYVSSVNGDSGAVTGISKVSETGYSLELSMDSSTFVITATLKNKLGTALSTQTVDLPLESVVVSGSYDNVNKKVILTLKNGSTIEFSVADLVSGLQTEITPSNKLSVTLIDGLSAVATSGNYTDLTNKPTTLSSFTDDLGSSPVHTHSQYLTSHQDISGKENISNKVTTISSSSTDTQYPSAKAVYTEVNDLKEDLEDGTVVPAIADNLQTEKTTLASDFVYRPTASSFTNNAWVGTSIETKSGAIIKSIKGRTGVWRQRVDTSLYASTTINGITYTNNNDGTITANGTATALSYINHSIGNIVNGHKYLNMGCPSGGGLSTYRTYITGNIMLLDSGSGIIGTVNQDIEVSYVIAISSGVTVSNLKFIPQLIDLTDLYGAGNEPTTVAQFKKDFPLNYYNYNSGSIINFNGTGIKTIGFNAWDEEWELGNISLNTGELVSSSSDIRSKNFCRCFENTQYCLDNPSLYQSNCHIVLYDSNYNYIDYWTFFGASRIVTFNSNAYYFKVVIRNITTYNNDICINLSWSGTQNGKYEAYESHTKSLPISTYFANGMNGIGSVYDELTKDKATKRFSRIGLGSLNWVRSRIGGSGEYCFLSEALSSLAKGTTANVDTNLLCATYSASSANSLFNGNKGATIWSENNNVLYICDTTYTDATAFKNHFTDNDYLIYELATPVETSVDLDLSYECNDWGTEQLLPENTATPTTLPLKANIEYGLDIKSEVKNLKQDYISMESFTNLTNKLYNEYGITITPTFGTSQYDFAISGTPKIGGSNIATVSQVATKQDILTAGSGIDITNNIISVISGVYFEEDN